MTLSTDAIFQLVITLVAIGIAWGSLNTSVGQLRRTVDMEIRPDLKDLRERFIVVEERVSVLWKDRIAPQHSLRQLNALGVKILSGSGIKEIVNKQRFELLQLVRDTQPKTAYDADQAIAAVMATLPNRHPDLIDELKAGAFKTGSDVDTVLFVGALHLRDLIFPDLGFTIDDLKD